MSYCKNTLYFTACPPLLYLLRSGASELKKSLKDILKDGDELSENDKNDKEHKKDGTDPEKLKKLGAAAKQDQVNGGNDKKVVRPTTKKLKKPVVKEEV